VVSYAVVGGGVIGAAVARRLLQVEPGAEVTLFEKEGRLAQHQTGRNSGVVHAGLYYQPGSLKALLCRRGVFLLKEFCDERGLRYDVCGKVLVALDELDQRRLCDIADRAQRNGVPGVRQLDARELRDLEPHVTGVAGLHSPTTAIVDFGAVTRGLADDARSHGASVRTSSEVTTMVNRHDKVVLSTSTDEADFDAVIVCAGLQADRLARKAGDRRDPRIVPFRGQYFRLRPDRRSLVRGLVYPVPDLAYPFLGVHLTPRIDGEVLIGPNAVLALAREGYGRLDVSGRDVFDILSYQGFRRFARQHWRTGIAEMRNGSSRRTFLTAARRYVPELTDDDLLPGPVGIRAQAMDADGRLVDDFDVTQRGRMMFVRNAPSPAATSALAIAEHVVSMTETSGLASHAGR
jgi:(S)-2-hydroxyglutarate dehydrogenase